MENFERPQIFISRCIEHQACRWNAMMIGCPFVRALKPHVDFITLCPEADIGLGIPRDPIRVIREAGELRLYQPATGRDLTETMKAYCEDRIPHLAGLDGFILKEKSPSCGNREVKVYAGKGKDARVEGKDAGFFGAAVTQYYPEVPVENEGRLQNFTLREQFYTAVFTRADFRRVKQEGSMRALVDFQARNKLLFMAHNQAAMREMGRLTAN
ncbi:MAG: DUF1722 domain-containing protein, partial [Spirochaetales bacterium]|nr:DUF1722 domain-containing protein [Spirochaetales bacterium]